MTACSLSLIPLSAGMKDCALMREQIYLSVPHWTPNQHWLYVCVSATFPENVHDVLLIYFLLVADRTKKNGLVILCIQYGNNAVILILFGGISVTVQSIMFRFLNQTDRWCIEAVDNNFHLPVKILIPLSSIPQWLLISIRDFIV